MSSETLIPKTDRSMDPSRTDLWKEAVGTLDSMTTLVMILLEMKHITHDQRLLAAALKAEAANLATTLIELRIRSTSEMRVA